MVKVAALVKTGKVDIIRPSWLFDCIKQIADDFPRPNLLLPLEPWFVVRDQVYFFGSES